MRRAQGRAGAASVRARRAAAWSPAAARRPARPRARRAPRGPGGGPARGRGAAGPAGGSACAAASRPLGPQRSRSASLPRPGRGGRGGRGPTGGAPPRCCCRRVVRAGVPGTQPPVRARNLLRACAPHGRRPVGPPGGRSHRQLGPKQPIKVGPNQLDMLKGRSVRGTAALSDRRAARRTMAATVREFDRAAAGERSRTTVPWGRLLPTALPDTAVQTRRGDCHWKINLISLLANKRDH